MTESEFFQQLEFRLCREFEALRLPAAPALWCDGLIPEHWQLDSKPPAVSGTAWFGGLPGKHPAAYQEDWVFVLEIHHDVKARESILWSNLFPETTARNWAFADVERRHLHISLPPSGHAFNGAA